MLKVRNHAVRTVLASALMGHEVLQIWLVRSVRRIVFIVDGYPNA